MLLFREACVSGGKSIVHQRKFVRALVLAIILASLTCLGFLLRWQYAASSSPFWDEFITLWSARNVIEGAVSPLRWGPGADAPLFRDLTALVLWLFGFRALVARSLSIAISVTAIPLSFYAGKWMFSVPAGILAATMMAVIPQVVVEGARARPYSLFLLLTLLAALLFYWWIIEDDDAFYVRHGRAWPFVACFVAATFTHLEAALLLPGFVLGALARHGPRGLMRKSVVFAFILCGVGVVAALALFYRSENTPGAIALSEGVWAGSAQIELGVKNVGVFVKLLRRTPGGFGLLVVAVGGLAYSAAWSLGRRFRGKALSAEGGTGGLEDAQLVSAAPVDTQNHGLVFISVMLLWATCAIILILGPRWGSETRYILFLVPLFSLIVGATAVRFIGFLVERAGIGGETVQRWAVLGSVAVGMGLIGVPSIVDEQRFREEWGYDLAFEYVAHHLRGDDAVVTVAPMACLVSLEQCDYVAIQTAYETYAVEEKGRVVEVETRLPLIMTVPEMEEVLDQYQYVWFVTDEGRFLSRYTADFVQLIWDRMELCANERGALVFRSLWQEQPVEHHVVEANFEDKFILRGFSLSRGAPGLADQLDLTLRWQGVEFAHYYGLDYSVFVHLVDPDGELWAQSDGYPVAGRYPTSHWHSTDVVIPDRRTIVLPPHLPPGRYRLDAGMYLLSTGERLQVFDESGSPVGDKAVVGYVTVGEEGERRLSPAYPLPADLGGEIRMLGYDLAASTLAPGQDLDLTVYWQALVEMERDYTVFVHLVGQDGQIVSQQDGQPEKGFYSTSFWDRGEVVRDEHVLSLPSDVQAGEYELRAGMYLLQNMQRLPVEGKAVEGDWVVLTTIHVSDE